jgi:hypothetical protein
VCPLSSPLTRINTSLAPLWAAHILVRLHSSPGPWAGTGLFIGVAISSGAAKKHPAEEWTRAIVEDHSIFLTPIQIQMAWSTFHLLLERLIWEYDRFSWILDLADSVKALFCVFFRLIYFACHDIIVVCLALSERSQ